MSERARAGIGQTGLVGPLQERQEAATLAMLATLRQERTTTAKQIALAVLGLAALLALLLWIERGPDDGRNMAAVFVIWGAAAVLVLGPRVLRWRRLGQDIADGMVTRATGTAFLVLDRFRRGGAPSYWLELADGRRLKVSRELYGTLLQHDAEPSRSDQTGLDLALDELPGRVRIQHLSVAYAPHTGLVLEPGAPQDAAPGLPPPR